MGSRSSAKPGAQCALPLFLPYSRKRIRAGSQARAGGFLPLDAIRRRFLVKNTDYLLVLNVDLSRVAGWDWGLLGWLLLIIVDHSRKFPAFSISKIKHVFLKESQHEGFLSWNKLHIFYGLLKARNGLQSKFPTSRGCTAPIAKPDRFWHPWWAENP